MNIILEEIISGLPDVRQMVSLVSRLLTAMILGALVGVQREQFGKPAGLRTHILVAMGAALFVLAPLEAGMELDGISRAIQGIVTGIGFIGAGAILKLQEKREIEGLTTAAGVWMTAAIGIAAGLGRLGIAVIGTMLTVSPLSVIGKIETWMNQKQ